MIIKSSLDIIEAELFLYQYMESSVVPEIASRGALPRSPPKPSTVNNTFATSATNN